MRGASSGSRGRAQSPAEPRSVPSRRKHRRDQLAHQRPVAIGERRQPGMNVLAVEVIVERPMPAQHPVQDIDGDPPRREARNFRVLHPLGTSSSAPLLHAQDASANHSDIAWSM